MCQWFLSPEAFPTVCLWHTVYILLFYRKSILGDEPIPDLEKKVQKVMKNM